jgi:hypothetical protein
MGLHSPVGVSLLAITHGAAFPVGASLLAKAIKPSNIIVA